MRLRCALMDRLQIQVLVYDTEGEWLEPESLVLPLAVHRF